MENNMYNQQDTNEGQFTSQDQNYYAQQGGYQTSNAYPNNGYQNSDLETPVTMGEWVISMLLMCIPCVNVIMMFVWAFGKNEKKSKSNFFKAALIFYAIAIVFSIVVYGSLAATMITAMEGMY